MIDLAELETVPRPTPGWWSRWCRLGLRERLHWFRHAPTGQTFAVGILGFFAMSGLLTVDDWLLGGGSVQPAFSTLGVMLLCLAYQATLWVYLYQFEERRFFRPTYAMLITALTLGALGHLKLLVVFGWMLYAFPLAFYALTLTIFTLPRIAILASSLLVFLSLLTLRVDAYPLAVLLFGGLVGIFILSRSRRLFSDRSRVLVAGLWVGLANALIILAVVLLDTGRASQPPDSVRFWHDLITVEFWGALISGAVSGVLALGLLPLFEGLFRLVTPYRLMELGTHDHPLLRRMQLEAPGTFHHSLLVASLAEAAAEAIGANPLLTRVGALYHDIGKMRRPVFFIENQAYFGVDNPHEKLTPHVSKNIVIAHPKDSLEMAREFGLPEVIQKFMTEHHGTLVAGYFYNQACLQHGADNVDKDSFRYPGPKPDIRETAIVMLADACESSVRALKTPSLEHIEERINVIIRQRIEDGQFDHCPLTMKDIATIRETFLHTLRGIKHERIEYQLADIRHKLDPPESGGCPEPDC